ncbi:uncharacterized protein LOC141595321 [Silene latifolia]|uniref:uncharacterized protein LOC141595321 n=1 Tax=Silene latifolia TaxID=37657 RepID=UPI003D780BF3
MHNNGVGLFGLLETKLKPSSLLNKATTICDGWSNSTNCSWHKGGRIWLLWNPTCFDVQFLNYGSKYIHMLVQSKMDNKKFLLTMIYAFNDLKERTILWKFLKETASTCTMPWLWVGYFNTVLSPIERLGGNTTDAEMEHFQECVSLCEMEDIKATGALFTWSNKQAPTERVYSRLDRAMGNPEWLSHYGDYVAHFHPEGMFDHCPCTIVDRRVEFNGRKSFKYFNMWGASEHFAISVDGVWKQSYKGTKMFNVVKKLKALKPVLKNLNKNYFSDIENSTSIAGTVLQKIQKELVEHPGDLDLIQQEYDLANELKDLIVARDSFLSQKAKIQWSIAGDLNTSYFHQVIKKRVMLNKVMQIEDMNGSVYTTGDAIQQAFLAYYQDLLGSHTDTVKVQHHVVTRGPCCTEAHWHILHTPITAEEVKKSIFSIPKDKSPGPDGYTSQF